MTAADDDARLLALVNEETRLSSFLVSKQNVAFSFKISIDELTEKKQKVRYLLIDLFQNLHALKDAPVVGLAAFHKCVEGIKTYQVAAEHFELEMGVAKKRFASLMQECQKAEKDLQQVRNKISKERDVQYGILLPFPGKQKS